MRYEMEPHGSQLEWGWRLTVRPAGSLRPSLVHLNPDTLTVGGPWSYYLPKLLGVWHSGEQGNLLLLLPHSKLLDSAK